MLPWCFHSVRQRKIEYRAEWQIESNIMTGQQTEKCSSRLVRVLESDSALHQEPGHGPPLAGEQPHQYFLSDCRLRRRVRAPLIRRWEIPARPCLKAFWFPSGPDLPLIPAMKVRIRMGRQISCELGDSFDLRPPLFRSRQYYGMLCSRKDRRTIRSPGAAVGLGQLHHFLYGRNLPL